MLGCTDIRIRKFEFAAKTQFLCNVFVYFALELATFRSQKSIKQRIESIVDPFKNLILKIADYYGLDLNDFVLR